MGIRNRELPITSCQSSLKQHSRIMSSQAPRVPLVTQRITARQLQRLETLKLHYDISQSAIICMRCGFALKNDGDRAALIINQSNQL
ncbi:hypothetical protein BKA60DRAFT_174528 [Fusarium oxysporum]|nr:hypothetical protein BKA60DRAFT_174528 [Fusarium oxysporum]